MELIRLSPGTRLGLHRHTGEVHALTLAGERRLNDGLVVRPGDYIHEPAGNVDWWEATGTEELLVYVVVKGSVEYLGRTMRCCSGSLRWIGGRTTTAGVKRWTWCRVVDAMDVWEPNRAGRFMQCRQAHGAQKYE